MTYANPASAAEFRVKARDAEFSAIVRDTKPRCVPDRIGIFDYREPLGAMARYLP
jgi:hypothetical protein